MIPNLRSTYVVQIIPEILSQLDLSIRAGGLNTGRVYSCSGKIRVECISNSDKIRAVVFRFYGFQIHPTGLKRLFSELFLFFVKIKKLTYLLLKIVCI